MAKAEKCREFGVHLTKIGCGNSYLNYSSANHEIVYSCSELNLRLCVIFSSLISEYKTVLMKKYQEATKDEV